MGISCSDPSMGNRSKVPRELRLRMTGYCAAAVREVVEAPYLATKEEAWEGEAVERTGLQSS